MPAKEFNPVELAATLGRMQAGTDASAEVPQPLVDPKLAAEVRKQAAGGRNEIAYVPVLEYYGFECFPVGTLAHADGMPKMENEWRSDVYHLAFTSYDLLTMFRSPEDFDTWMKEYRQKKLMRKLKREKRL